MYVPRAVPRQRSQTVEQPSAGLYESAVVMFEAMRAREHRARRGARGQGWRLRHRVSDAEGTLAAGAAVWTITGRGGYDSSRGGGSQCRRPRTGREVECVSRAGLA